MEILLASTNQGKLAELTRLFADLPGFSFRLGPGLDVPETGTTFAQNAALKATATMQVTGKACLADDSGLAVDALGGRPGVYSARYAPTDEDRIAKLLGELAGTPPEQRTASFVCAMALARPGEPLIAVEGRCKGVITDAPRGSGGFGYDPVFLVPLLGRTFAEMSAGEKNRVSHRAQATARLKSALMAIAPEIR